MKLFRISNILILAGAAFLGSLLFWTSQSVQKAQDDLAALSQKTRAEEESLNVLSAEWDYLNRPQRLEELAQDYLRVEAPGEKSIVTEAGIIMEPAAPVLPRAKPAIIPAAVRPPAVKKSAPAPVIDRQDSAQFDELMKNLSGGGE